MKMKYVILIPALIGVIGLANNLIKPAPVAEQASELPAIKITAEAASLPAIEAMCKAKNYKVCYTDLSFASKASAVEKSDAEKLDQLMANLEEICKAKNYKYCHTELTPKEFQ